MPLSGEQLNITSLDFETIKGNLIDFFKSGSNAFTDWNFDGSNLNTIIDLLAYNTHYNAMLAHMAVNESFIDSAQLRSSVVSMSKLLGYVPRSFSAASAQVDAVFNANASAESLPVEIRLPRGTKFSTTYNDVAYSFVTLDEDNILYRNTVSSSPDVYEYSTAEDEPLTLYQGRLINQTYAANTDTATRYQIEDEDIDISTLKVLVYPTSNLTDGSGQVYRRYTDIAVSSDSAVYFIQENSFGKYEIFFGNGIFGKSLSAGNFISIEYLTTKGAAPNGSKSPFTLVTTFNEIDTTKSITYFNNSTITGGSDKESVARLKENATNAFITQNRAVTADDYRSIITSYFQYVQSVSVWGGEDNEPPEYGKAFISIKPHSTYEGSILSATDKDKILSYLKSKKVLSIFPEIVDPEYVNIVLDVLFKYDSNITTKSSSDLENDIIQNVLTDYNNNVLNAFDTLFRHSQFVATVDNYARSIINSHVRVFVKQDVTIPSSGARSNITVKFNVPLDVDDDRAIIDVKSSIRWTENEESVYLADEADTTNGNNVRNLYTYTLTGSTRNKLRDVGKLYLSTGVIEFNTSIYADDDVTLTILALPESNDIVGKRNILLRIDADECTVKGYPDEIAVGGSSRTVDYETFPRER